MDKEIVQALVRSRGPLLDMMACRGYDVAAAQQQTAAAVEACAAAAQPGALTCTLNLVAPALPGAGAAMERCVLVYLVDVRSRSVLSKSLARLWEEDAGVVPQGCPSLHPARDEVMVVLTEDLRDAVHAAVAAEWHARRGRVTLFLARDTVINPARHVLVPPHRRLSPEEAAELITLRIRLKSRRNLPHIIFHVDAMARAMGLVPDDIVEVRRPSPTAGEHVSYRVCVER